MSAQADTNCHDIFNFVSATRTHLAKIGATRCVVADMSRHVGTTRLCRSNFGEMGPCRRHKIEDVVAVCVGLSRHLPDFRNSYVEIYYSMGVHTHRYPTLISVMFWFVMFSSLSCSGTTHTHTTLTRIENTHNSHMNSAPQHHPPMPPTKAMGAITQNRRGHPTATP